MALNRKLYGLSGTGGEQPEHEPKPMPFAAQRRHQYWSVDIRYLDVAHVGGKVYCVSILETFSRAILASGIFPQQDLGTYLMILYAAIRQHGIPETLISDSVKVFVTAKQAKAFYPALGIEKREIDRGRPWQWTWTYESPGICALIDGKNLDPWGQRDRARFLCRTATA